MEFIQKRVSTITDVLNANTKNFYVTAILLLMMIGTTRVALEIDPMFTPMGTVLGLIFGLILIFNQY